MDSLFQNLINQGKIGVYMDNVLIFSKTLEEYVGIVKEVLEILNKNKLSIQTKKYWFHQTKIEYLGTIISKDRIEVDPAKIKGISD